MDPAVLKIIKKQREKAAARKRRPPRVSTWTQRERFGDEITESFNIVLVTRGCRWYSASGCSMCGYSNDSALPGTAVDIPSQLDKVRSLYKDQPLVKVFTSGSFFDEKELEPEERFQVLSLMKELLEGKDAELIVESRPQFVSEGFVKKALSSLDGPAFTVAMGLESSNDRVLKESINKGFTFQDYKDAAGAITAAGGKVKTYLMLKPPFLSEADAVRDCLDSIRDISALEIPQVISINPMNIQAFTLVDHLFHRGEYRPPWLYSAVGVLKQGRGIISEGTWLLCHPSAGGKSRGIHNCGSCDAEFLEAISDFSLTNEPSALDGLVCGCSREYDAYLLDYE